VAEEIRQIHDSVAVVTGAGSGIGHALAISFAAAGAAVVVGDLDAAAAERTALAIRDGGGSSVAVGADASSTDGIATLNVANAGIMGAPGLGDDENDWDRIIDVNLRGHVRRRRRWCPNGWSAAPDTSSP
jgi:NAD(P)-dependent dehydrogenase (short-subunit alcohol dehydrogenase family)